MWFIQGRTVIQVRSGTPTYLEVKERQYIELAGNQITMQGKIGPALMVEYGGCPAGHSPGYLQRP